MLLRLLVTTILLIATILFHLQERHQFLVDPVIPLYGLVGTIFVLSLIYAVVMPLIKNVWTFSFLQIVIDVVYFTFLVYFTGATSSPFTLIYTFPIFAAGMLHFRRGALFIASLAAICFGLLVNLQIHGIIPSSEWPWQMPWVRQTPGYALWVTVVHFTVFFLTAFLASSLAEQLQRARVVLQRREVDYRKLRDLHSNIVRSIPSGIITTDELDRVTFVNGSGARLLGAATPELVGLAVQEVFPTIEKGLTVSSVRRETYITAKEVHGQQLQLELTVSDLRGDDGVPSGRLVVFQDITDIRKMEERVKLSEKQAAFVRIAQRMAHEIRNPLAALRGASELLSMASASSSKDQKLLRIVIREADRLNTLLGDFLLTLSSQKPKKTLLNLSAIVQETVDLFSQEQRVNDAIRLETLINTGVEVEGDAARLRQAFWNLLTNALEATPDGGVIRVRLESHDDAGMAVFSVQDTGPGIPTEIRDRIFEPFTTSKERGTGLGLAIVLSVVEGHGGSVETARAHTTGTIFTVKLPVARDALSRAQGE